MSTLDHREPDIGFLLRAPKAVPSRAEVLKTFTKLGIGHMVGRVMMRDGKVEVNLSANMLALSKLGQAAEALKPVEVHIATGKGGPTLYLNYR